LKISVSHALLQAQQPLCSQRNSKSIPRYLWSPAVPGRV